MRKKHYAFVFCSFMYFFTFSETPEREENEYTSNKYTETADEFGISTADIERSKADYKCTFCFFFILFYLKQQTAMKIFF